jgi:hypothetical protein
VASLGFENILLFWKASKIAGALQFSKRQWLGTSSLIYIFQWQGDPNLLLEMPAYVSMDSQK